MNCPACGNKETSVSETRRALVGSDVQRRHKCDCGARWVSLQRFVRGSLTTLPLATGSGLMGGGRPPDKPSSESPQAVNESPSAAQAPMGGGGASVSGLFPESDLSGPSKPDHLSHYILEVFAHYRTFHPQAHKVPKPGKEWRLIRNRMAEGHTVQDLKQSIDGYHADPWYQGKNDRGRPYLRLDLIMRDASHVQQGIELLRAPKRNTSPAKLPEVKSEPPAAKDRIRASWTQPESAGALLDALPGWANGGKP